MRSFVIMCTNFHLGVNRKKIVIFSRDEGYAKDS